VTVTRALPGDAIHHLMIHNSGSDLMEVYGAAPDDHAWVIRNDTLPPSGRIFTGPADMAACGPQADRSACPKWLDTQHLTQRLSYVPAARFWALQWRELGVLIVISLAVAALCGWWIRRRAN
jgi:hypothetical protein